MNQEQLLLLAKARKRKADEQFAAAQEQERLSQPPSWSDVMRNVAPQVVAGTADLMLNTPANVANLAKAAYGTAVTSLGGEMPKDPQEAYRQQLRANLFQLTGGNLGEPIPYTSGVAAAPEVEIPANTATDYFKEQGFIKDLQNMTPQQRIASTAAQAALGSVVGGGGGATQFARNVLTGATAGGAGQAVTEATGSPVAGLATSVLTPLAGSRIGPLNTARTQESLINQELNRTLNEARDIGFLVVPEGVVASASGRNALVRTVEQKNQRNLDRIARESLGLEDKYPLSFKSLREYRTKEYNLGYAPFKSMKPFDLDKEYLDDLMEAKKKAGSGWDKRSDVDQFIASQLPEDMLDGANVVERIKELRDRANTNFNADSVEKKSLAAVEKASAEALEGLLARKLREQMGTSPEGAARAEQVLQRFQESRKKIAIAHTIGNAVIEGKGQLDINKLASALQGGAYMTGNLEKAARFGNVYTSSKPDKLRQMPFSYTVGLASGGAAASALGLDPSLGIALAAGGALAGRAAALPMQAAMRNYLLSFEGQRGAMPNYMGLGVNPGMAFPAAVGMFSTMQNQPEENQ